MEREGARGGPRDEGRDELKYEVARELGLDDDIRRRGWENLTTREVGRIGGQMVRRMIRFAERHLGRRERMRDRSRP
ncbi:MAG: alpha/beta-type small acid-soluble spore protein [Clostridia bacterium]|nr:alpha/beta-type small acid-soluble spore protein [Clostridia bacterium]